MPALFSVLMVRNERFIPTRQFLYTIFSDENTYAHTHTHEVGMQYNIVGAIISSHRSQRFVVILSRRMDKIQN